MAIGTDALIEFFGTQDTLGTTPSDVTDGSFSDGINDLVAWTNDDDARLASVTLEFDFAVTPDPNSVIALFGRKTVVEGSNDDSVPSLTYQHTPLGVFSVKETTSPQDSTIEIELDNWKTSSIWHFYVKNNSGQTMSAWDLHITPKTDGPHA